MNWTPEQMSRNELIAELNNARSEVSAVRQACERWKTELEHLSWLAEVGKMPELAPHGANTTFSILRTRIDELREHVRRSAKWLEEWCRCNEKREAQMTGDETAPDTQDDTSF